MSPAHTRPCATGRWWLVNMPPPSFLALNRSIGETDHPALPWMDCLSLYLQFKPARVVTSWPRKTGADRVTIRGVQEEDSGRASEKGATPQARLDLRVRPFLTGGHLCSRTDVQDVNNP